MNKTVQRVIIWIIAITMLLGTLGAYFLVILSNDNAARQQQEQALANEQVASCLAPTESDKTFTKPEAVPFEAATVTELRTEDVTVGTGDEVTSTEQCVVVHYLGNTADGNVFDNSYDRGEPFATLLNQVIPGWQEGIIGMKEGGARKLFIPSDKAYGDTTAEGIPSGPLYFYVELVEIK